MVTDDATVRAQTGDDIPVWQRMGLGVLVDQIPAALVDQVLADTERVQQRLRRLPARVMVWFVLALTLFHGEGYATCGANWPTARTMTRRHPPRRACHRPGAGWAWPHCRPVHSAPRPAGHPRGTPARS